MVGTKVYVGGLPYGVRERDLEKFVKGYGRIRDVILKNGFGFVEFEDYRDADDAVYELNGKSLLGERVTVEIAKGIDRSQDRGGSRRGYGGYGGRAPPPRRWGGEYGPPTRSDHRLIVENLSSRVSWQPNVDQPKIYLMTGCQKKTQGQRSGHIQLNQIQGRNVNRNDFNPSHDHCQ